MATDTLATEDHRALPAAAGNAPQVATTIPAPAFALTPAVLLALAIGCVIALAFAPLVHTHGLRLWERPHYQFFPFAIAGALFLAWSYGRKVRTPLTPGSGGVALVGFTLAWLMLAAAEIFFSPALAGAAALVLLGVLIYAVGGVVLLRALLPAWAFLWIMIPPPFGLDGRIVAGLQTLTSQVASAVLDTLGVLHLLEGNVVQISGQRLLVEEACAGVSSLFSLLACTLFLVLWLRRPWLRSCLLLASSIGWVIVSNVVRVVTIAYLYDRYGLDLSIGIKHDLLGFACFAMAVLLIWSMDRLVLFLLPRVSPPTPEPAQPTAPAGQGGAAVQALVRVLSWPMAVAFGLLLLLHTVTYGLTPPEMSAVPLPTIARLTERTLPEELAGWKRRGFTTETRNPGSAFGEYSTCWIYETDQRRALIAIDYPFPGYHVLDVCYIKQGWTVDRGAERRGAVSEGTLPFWAEVKFTKPGMQSGFLLYSEINQNGMYLEHEADMLRAAWKRYETALNSWRQRWNDRDASERLRERGPVYQFQLFIEGHRPLTPDEEEAAQLLFFQAVERLHKELYSGE
jgi:exosortase